MEKGVNKLVDGYKYFTGGNLKVKKTPGAPVKTLSNIEL